MNIHDAIAKHPNLLNNYRRAALCFVLAGDMADRGEYGFRRDEYILNCGHYIGKAQGWLHRHYGVAIDGYPFVIDLADRMRKYGGDVSAAGLK